MNDQQLFEAVRATDPLRSRTLGWPEPVLERVLAAASFDSTPRRRRARRLAPLAAIAVTLAVAAPAFGLGLTRLFNGTPAPPAVTNELTPGNNGHPPTVLAEVQLTTSEGYTAGLYATHLDGRDCLYVRVTDGGSTVRGGALCPRPVPGSAIDLVTSGATRVDGDWVKVVYGHLSGNVASAAIRFGDGHETAVPLSDGYFLHELVAGETEPMTLIERDSAGKQIAQQIPSIRTAP